MTSHYVEPEVRATAAAEFRDAGRVVVLDDFLSSRFAGALRPTDLSPELFRAVRGLYPLDPAQYRGVLVDNETFERFSDRQMFRFLELDADAVEESTLQRQHPWLTFLLALWTDERLGALVADVTGVHGSGLRVEFHRMGSGDFIGWHTDSGDGRALALTYYIGVPEGSTGGDLEIRATDGAVRTVHARANRLVIFDVDGHDRHRVTTVGGADGSYRHSLSIWLLT